MVFEAVRHTPLDFANWQRQGRVYLAVTDAASNVNLPAVAGPTTEPAARARGTFMAAFALVVVHFLWITAHLAPAIMSPDANGYVVQARLLAEEGRTSFATASPVQFVGMHWLETERGVFHSRYPAGLPLIFGLAWKLGGLGAALYVNPLLASATVFLVFLLARRLVRGVYALIAAAVVAAVPVANQHALDADAHVAATFFLVGGVLALLRFGETRAVPIGLLAGGLLGAVPAMRYPEAIVGVTIVAWLLWRVRPLVHVWPAIVGAAVPIGGLCLHNAAAYGAFWRTGYALTNEQTGFGLSYFTAHALPYLQALGGQGIALFFAFGAAGLAALVADTRRRSEGVLFAGIVVPLVLLYMAYYFGGGMGAAAGNLRFLIPTFPFFAVAGVWLLARMAEQLGAAGRAAVAVVAALQLIVGVGASAQMLASAKTSLQAAARARVLADKEIPPGSVVIVDRQLAESFDALGRWKIVEESFLAGGGPGPGGMGQMGRQPNLGAADGPSPMQRGKNQAQQERYAGLEPGERRTRAWADLAAWAKEKPIFWYARSLDVLDRSLPAGADYRSIAEVDAPTMMGPGGGGGGPPGMMAPGMMPGGRGGRGGDMAGPGGPGGGGPGRGMGGGNFAPPGRGPGGMMGGRGGAPGAGSGVPAKLRVVRIELPKG